MQIAAKMVNLLDIVENAYTWRLSLKGDFSVWSAFWALNEIHHSGTTPIPLMEKKWKILWKLKLTERQKFFGWLLLHDRIMTKTLLAHRGMTSNVAYVIYDGEEESPLHLFRDCRSTNGVWHHLIPPQLTSTFYVCSLNQWIEMNMFVKGYKWEGLEWRALFVLVCWWLWKFRNDRIFNEASTTLAILLLRQQTKELVHALQAGKGKP